MNIYKGKSVFKGIAIGKIKIYQKEVKSIQRYQVKDTTKEIKRFKEAKSQAILELQKLYEQAAQDLDQESASIFEVHQMMLTDQDYIDSVTENIVTEKVNAEYAISKTKEDFARSFEELEDSYMKERAADVRNVSDRLLNILQNNHVELGAFSEEVILLTDDLTPGETIQLDKDKILSFVTQYGSANSHTAILARMMNIPSLVSTEIPLEPELDGQLAIVDGFSGKIYLNPDEKTLTQMQKQLRKISQQKTATRELIGQKSVSLDGHPYLFARKGYF